MPFTHHSHSGQYCAHAVDELDSIVHAARQKNMRVFALTEHVPRQNSDLYPEEIGFFDENSLAQRFANFINHAKRLRAESLNLRNVAILHASVADPDDVHINTSILIGFEVEWIHPESNSEAVYYRQLYENEDFDIFIGSVHHLFGIPIDYDVENFMLARSRSPQKSDASLIEHYFDVQYDMLQKLRPPIVGHFDLIRLLSTYKNDTLKSFPQIWAKIIRNLHFVKSYGGTLELNSSALRKGLNEPYPQRDIVLAWKEMNGQFVMSDDSHGIDQIACHYTQLFEFIKSCQLAHISYFEPTSHRARLAHMSVECLENIFSPYAVQGKFSAGSLSSTSNLRNKQTKNAN